MTIVVAVVVVGNEDEKTILEGRNLEMVAADYQWPDLSVACCFG